MVELHLGARIVERRVLPIRFRWCVVIARDYRYSKVIR